jgi:hypothetical protein
VGEREGEVVALEGSDRRDQMPCRALGRVAAQRPQLIGDVTIELTAGDRLVEGGLGRTGAAPILTGALRGAAPALSSLIIVPPGASPSIITPWSAPVIITAAPAPVIVSPRATTLIVAPWSAPVVITAVLSIGAVIPLPTGTSGRAASLFCRCAVTRSVRTC